MRKFFRMGLLALVLVVCCWSDGLGQTIYPKLVFTRKANSSFFLPRLASTADSALLLAAAVLNSQVFRDELAKYSFPCKNYSFTKRCPSGCVDCGNAIIGTKTILDSLYRKTHVSLCLVLDNQDGGSFGDTAKDSDSITSHYPVVFDTRKMPFSYHYAVHLCHEYMHNVGWYHFKSAWLRNAKKDIAEQTGNTAYDILLGWYTAGKKPF